MKRKKESKEKRARRKVNSSLGGKKTLKKYGKDHFRNLALARHAKAKELKEQETTN